MLKALIKLTLLFVVALVCVPAASYAQCSGPPGVSGEREWVGGSSKYQLCDGSDWVDFSCKGVGGCIPTTLDYESKVIENGVSVALAATGDKSKLVAAIQWSGLKMFDISSSPSAPTHLGSISGADYNDTNDVEVYGDYAFSAGRGGAGLVSTDISTPGSMSKESTALSSPADEMDNLWGVGLTEDGQYAVTASWQSGYDNRCYVHVVDISDPTSISVIGTTDFGWLSGSGRFCSDVVIKGNYAFLPFADAPGGIGVVDITTKSAPWPIAYVENVSGTQSERITFSEDGQYVFTANRGDSSVSSFDVSTPTSPTYSDNYQNTSYMSDAYAIDVLGNALIIPSLSDDAAVVLDVSDPTNMTFVDAYQSAGNIGDPAAALIVDRYAYIAGYGVGSIAVFDLGCDVGDGSVSCNTLGSCSTAAEMDWDGTEDAYKYCDGSDWVEIGCSGDSCPASFGSCSKEAEVTYFDGVLYQCDGSDWQPMVDGEALGGGAIVLTSGSSWTVPLDWNNSNNTIHVIGGGGGGVAAGGGAGGGGGAYSAASNVTLTPGGTVSYSVGAGGAAGDPGGADGGNTWFCNSTSNCGSIGGGAVVAGAEGGEGGLNGGGGTGGFDTSGVGSVKYEGGAGGYATDWGGAGGGGAAGPNGDGGPGGYTEWESGGGGGGGGGGADGGDVPSNSEIGQDGGNNSSGYGGGDGGGGGGSGDRGPGFPGVDGGGGGGGGGENDIGGGAGGDGVEWGTAGSGGGGGGAGSENNSSLAKGGDGGLYGGGGGGMGNAGDDGGAGAQGVIVITYTP